MGSLDDPATSKGSTILITEVNDFLGSQIANHFLNSDYAVRGTVLNVKKSAWPTDFFLERHPKTTFKLIKVPDITAQGAFSEAVTGKLDLEVVFCSLAN
ncbi:NAD dependent epimerase dehydratase [Fusarium heterosporum]|uniref:NAD dependent epimerase dehydratase n=1 Tax=Fusarium heterosporum TaxID=42747 RepID=A0A8H5TP83_FUSHE|nr:NAD dependent epimerase dehydratase [Fusarium heterosporum]